MDFQDAVAFYLGNWPVYRYGIYLAVGVLFALTMFYIRMNKKPKGAAAVCSAIMLPLAFLFSRIFFCVTDQSIQDIGAFMPVFRITAGGFSMYGALFGAVLGALIGSILIKTDYKPVLDALAPSLLLFVAWERLGEHGTGLGLSRELKGAFLQSTFLAAEEYGIYYLRTYLIEAIFCLVLVLALLLTEKRRTIPGHQFFVCTLVYGAVQTLLESLRFDQHMKFSFIGFQQIISFALMALVIILLAVRIGKHGNPALSKFAFATILPVLSLLIGIEFMLDRVQISRYLLYLVYALILAGMICLGIKMIRKEEAYGKEGH